MEKTTLFASLVVFARPSDTCTLTALVAVARRSQSGHSVGGSGDAQPKTASPTTTLERIMNAT
jgi:hypothetical protein